MIVPVEVENGHIEVLNIMGVFRVVNVVRHHPASREAEGSVLLVSAPGIYRHMVVAEPRPARVGAVPVLLGKVVVLPEVADG